MLKVARYMMGALLLLLAVTTWAAAAPASSITAGKQYQVLAKVPITSRNKMMDQKGRITVTEFFSYGCPACYHFESTLETWLGHKATDVAFQRVPVVFEPGWSQLAKVYYTASALHVAKKVSPHVFDAIWKQGNPLKNKADIQALFMKYGGVSAEQFNDVYDFSPMMANQIFNSEALMNSYKVEEVPTLIVDGKYKTSVAMAGSMDNTIAVLGYLINKQRHAKGWLSVSEQRQKAEQAHDHAHPHPHVHPHPHEHPHPHAHPHPRGHETPTSPAMSQ